MSNNGQVKEVELVTQFPSESGHWYSPETGLQVELPPRTWAKTAIKKGLVPGVTSITRLVARGALERWKINRAIWHANQLVSEDGYPQWGENYESLQCEVWERLDAESEAITGRGKELHAAIELAASGNDAWRDSGKWDLHVAAVIQELELLGIDLRKGSSEHSFAVPHYRGNGDLWTNGYGGKVDWHNDTWLLDFKTKARLTEPELDADGEPNPRAGKLKKLAYPEHAQQLAAYDRGVLGAPSSCWGLRCANVFVGVEDAAVHVHEWTQEQIDKGWRKFQHLLAYWWEDKQP